jgi:hypothetical protein
VASSFRTVIVSISSIVGISRTQAIILLLIEDSQESEGNQSRDRTSDLPADLLNPEV